jgi:hypothetical protein
MIVADGILHQVDSAAGTHYFYWNYSGYTEWAHPDIMIKLKPITDYTAGVLFRFDGTDGYCIRFKDADYIELGTYNTSTGFVQISETALARALGVWSWLRIAVLNNKILLLYSDDKYNWIKIFDVTDNTYLSPGKVGVITFDTDADFDGFEVGEIHAMTVGW